jgi:hypothetical protein
MQIDGFNGRIARRLGKLGPVVRMLEDYEDAASVRGSLY